MNGILTICPAKLLFTKPLLAKHLQRFLNEILKFALVMLKSKYGFKNNRMAVLKLYLYPNHLI